MTENGRNKKEKVSEDEKYGNDDVLVRFRWKGSQGDAEVWLPYPIFKDFREREDLDFCEIVDSKKI